MSEQSADTARLDKKKAGLYERSAWLKEAPENLVDAQRQITNLKQLVIDSCEDDTAIREMVRPLLGERATDGDSYGVPGVVDLVETLVKIILSKHPNEKQLTAQIFPTDAYSAMSAKG